MAVSIPSTKTRSSTSTWEDIFPSSPSAASTTSDTVLDGSEVASSVGGLLLTMPNYHTMESQSEREDSSARSAEASDQWAIEAIILGDDSSDANGNKIARGTFYGSGKQGGRHETFHAIEYGSVAFATHNGEAVSLRTRSLKKGKADRPPPCPLPAAKITRRKSAEQRKRVIAEAVRAYCVRNAGIAVIIGCTVDREANVHLRPYLVTGDEPTFATANEGRCIISALINAAGCLNGAAPLATVRSKLLKNDTHFTSLKPLGLVAHKIGLCVRRPFKKMRRDLNSDKFERAFSILADLKERVWIVRLCQPKVADHTVAIDANRGLIFDSAEAFPVKLLPNTL